MHKQKLYLSKLHKEGIKVKTNQLIADPSSWNLLTTLSLARTIDNDTMNNVCVPILKLSNFVCSSAESNASAGENNKSERERENHEQSKKRK
jgi:hypothetical protein